MAVLNTGKCIATFSDSHVWTQKQKDTLVLSSLISQVTRGLNLLYFCGLSHHTNHSNFLSFVPWLLWLTLFLQHPSHKTSSAVLLIPAFWLFVCWKPMWFPLCSFSWSEGCFCSFCNCIQLCVFMLKNFRSKQDLDRLKWFFFLKEFISLSLLEGIIRTEFLQITFAL